MEPVNQTNPSDKTNPSDIVPTGLQKSDDRHLVIDWSDGQQQRIPFRVLRDNCRCAHCTEKHKMYVPVEEAEAEKPKSIALPVLSLAESRPIEIVSMTPAGNYGYKVSFSDGHSSGIYSFELLRSIGVKPAAPENA